MVPTTFAGFEQGRLHVNLFTVQKSSVLLRHRLLRVRLILELDKGKALDVLVNVGYRTVDLELFANILGSGVLADVADKNAGLLVLLIQPASHSLPCFPLIFYL